LTRDTVLQLAPELEINISSGELAVQSERGKLHYQLRKLEILTAFINPCTLDEAMTALASTSPTPADWIDLSAMVLELVKGSVLVTPGENAPTLAPSPGGYAAAKIHIEMLNDVARTEAYVAAIRSNVREGDVVVDLGTGSGVLAVAAAQAGARQVYAIERSGIADRITMLRGHSTRVEVPEKADVLVSELVGNEPLAERLVEDTADAVARFLKPGGIQLPRRIRIFARGIRVTDDVIEEHLFSQATVSNGSNAMTSTYPACSMRVRNLPTAFRRGRRGRPNGRR
jgi:hypothetical protein